MLGRGSTKLGWGSIGLYIKKTKQNKIYILQICSFVFVFCNNWTLISPWRQRCRCCVRYYLLNGSSYLNYCIINVTTFPVLGSIIFPKSSLATFNKVRETPNFDDNNNKK